MLRILLLSGLLLSLGNVNAQRYRTAAGVRLGSNFGFSVQQKVFKYTTLEAIFQVPLRSTDNAQITILYEEHRKLLGKRLNFYYGAGVHKGWAAGSENPDPSGVSLIAGIEMSLDRLNISMDYKPAINAFSGDRFLESQSALTLRYIFVKQKKKKRNWKFWKKKH
ncbi:MAG: hypothetical protein ACI8P3_004098 [Saprospiraceae bacterium]|jgi:hypothetical protein